MTIPLRLVEPTPRSAPVPVRPYRSRDVRRSCGNGPSTYCRRMRLCSDRATMGIALALCLQMALLAAEGLPASDTHADTQPLFATPTRFDRIGRVIAPVLIDGKGP